MTADVLYYTKAAPGKKKRNNDFPIGRWRSRSHRGLSLALTLVCPFPSVLIPGVTHGLPSVMYLLQLFLAPQHAPPSPISRFTYTFQFRFTFQSITSGNLPLSPSDMKHNSPHWALPVSLDYTHTHLLFIPLGKDGLHHACHHSLSTWSSLTCSHLVKSRSSLQVNFSFLLVLHQTSCNRHIVPYLSHTILILLRQPINL